MAIEFNLGEPIFEFVEKLNELSQDVDAILLKLSVLFCKITNNLTNCTTSNPAVEVMNGNPYTATITAISGYKLNTVIVKMNGVDITSTAYSDGKINISAVTGAVVITATAIMKTYVNQVPISIDTNGSIFNGKGWIGRTRLSSSGATKDQDYSSATGYIPVKARDVVRIKGEPFENGGEYVCAYTSSFGFIGYISGAELSTSIGTAVRSGDLTTVTLANNSNIKWIRVSLQGNQIEGAGSYMIVTVNEEIT